MARPRIIQRDQIRLAAARLLVRLLPEDITVEAIACEAGVSRGSLYNFFKNKDHILAAARGEPGAESAWDPGPDGTPARQALLRLAAAAFGRFRILSGGTVPTSVGVVAIRGEVENLTWRLADLLDRQDDGAARAFYRAIAGAVLLGDPPAGDCELAQRLADLLGYNDAS